MPVYLFYGEEDFLIAEKIKTIKAKHSNHDILDGESLTLESLSDAICGYSLFGGEKIVIVRDLEVEEEIQDQLLSLLKNVPPQTTVVFHLPEVDKRSKFFKWVDAHGETEEFKTFAPWDQRGPQSWIRSRVTAGGKMISSGAERLLYEICGNNLRSLTGEIEKLITYIGDRKEIGEDDVAALASPGEINSFTLLEALREKNLQKSLIMFQSLIKNGEDFFHLLSMLVSQYRLMLQIKDPKSPNGRIKGSPYFVRKCSENVDRFTLEELKKNMGALLETNLKLKTGQQQSVVFELLITSLCGN